MKVVIVVQARMGSRRLPGKVLMEVAGKPLLGYQIDRLRQLRNAHELVIATSCETGDDAIAAFCASEGVAVVRGSTEDVLSRYAAAAELTNADVVVRLTGDCPLIDPAIVDRVIDAYVEAPALQYVSNTIHRTYPRGMDVELFSRARLDDANARAVTRYDREHVTPFIKRTLAGTGLTRNVAGDQSLEAYRINVDHPSDYAIVKALIESGLPDYSLATLVRRAAELDLDLTEAEWQQREHDELLSRCGLGAAQFGMHYGRFNVDGRPSNEQLAEILEQARNFGLSSIDTAYLYGDSQAALGKCSDSLRVFEIVTKTPRFSDDEIKAEDALALRAAFRQSLHDLRLEAVNGLLIHHAPNLLAPGAEYLYDEMVALKRKGLVEHIGVSVYDAEVAEQIHAKFAMEIVQLPMNVFDQRPLTSGALHRLAASGIKVQVRSAFLQGLLLANPGNMGNYFDSARPVLKRFHAAASAAGVSVPHAALQFLLGIPEIDRVIVGVESVVQLRQLFTSFPSFPEIDYAQFSLDDPAILNPALWPKDN